MRAAALAAHAPAPALAGHELPALQTAAPKLALAHVYVAVAALCAQVKITVTPSLSEPDAAPVPPVALPPLLAALATVKPLPSHVVAEC